MELGLTGKTALVTGASQGIGLAIARALHHEGVSLVLVSQTEESLQKAARSITGAGKASQSHQQSAPVHPIAANLSAREEVERAAKQAIERLGHIDILVNNAARARTGSFFNVHERAMEEVWIVKGLGYVRMVRAIAPHMMERESGCIINIVGSTARTPSEDFIIGSMVNAALVNFTRGISRELARHNVRINSISPGWTLTEQQRRVFEMQAAAKGVSIEEIEQREARGIPARRLVRTEEVATLALLLASNALPAMTGEDIIIDGGANPSI
jgi:3-oxoacyl-[acyl-carrier protein] reductase/bacilysin biosynthesis oxidoreductase BacG